MRKKKINDNGDGEGLWIVGFKGFGVLGLAGEGGIIMVMGRGCGLWGLRAFGKWCGMFLVGHGISCLVVRFLRRGGLENTLVIFWVFD